MKHFKFIFLFSVLSITVTYAQTNTGKVTDLFNGVLNFEGANLNEDRPISKLNLLAAQQADTMVFLTKENITEVMREANKYQSCIVSVGRHTIILVKSWTNCSESGSWSYCMPYGTGYIQRQAQELEKKEDYIKNIIGKPDSQRRTLFLFKKK